MKKILILSMLLMLFTCSEVNAQLVKGNYLYGSTAGVNYGSDNSSRQFGVYLNPNTGILVTNKLAIGAKLPINYSHWKSNNDVRAGLLIGVYPYARYFFLKKSKSAFFTEINTGMDFRLYSTNRKKYPKSMGYLTGALSVGYTYFVNPNVGLELYLVQNGIIYEQRRSLSNKEYRMEFTGLALRFGFQVYLPSKKNKEQKIE